jgi:hypothetical protein
LDPKGNIHQRKKMPLAKFAHASNGKQNLRGYNIDYSLSSDNFTCYVNHAKKEAILAYVETRSTRHDIFVLHKLLQGKLHETHRHRHHMNIAEKFYYKYNHPGWKYALTGHGLGGRFAMDGSAHLRKKGKILPAEAYNPLFSHHDRSKYTNNDFANTVTHRDPNDFMTHNLSQNAGGFVINHEIGEDPNMGNCPSPRTGNDQPDTGTGSTTTTTPLPPNTGTGTGTGTGSTTTNPPPHDGTSTTQPPSNGDGKTPAKPPPQAQKASAPPAKKGGLFSRIGHYLKSESKKHPWEFWGTVVAGTLALGVATVLTGGATLEAIAAALPSVGGEAAAGYTAVAGSEAAAAAAEAAGGVASTAIDAEAATATEAATAGLDESFSSAVSTESQLDSSIASESSSEVSEFEDNSITSASSSSSNDSLLSESEYDEEDDALMRNQRQNNPTTLDTASRAIRNYAVDAVDRIQKLAELYGRPFIATVQRLGPMVGLSLELQNAIIAMIQTGVTTEVSYIIIKNEIVNPVENFIKECIKFHNDPHGYINSIRR